jgi:hypothetical protein
MAWKGIVAKAFTAEQFRDYVDGLVWKDWKPQFITLHNTAAPSLAQRPDGFLKQHILNLEAYYRDNRGWSAGPHLFIDDHVIWVFTPLTTPGVHSPSWNSTAIGIEMLGDYAKEEFTSGRGKNVRANAVQAIAALSKKLGFKPDAWKFHVQDTRSDHDCPGIKARKDRDNLVRDISAAMNGPYTFPDKPIKLPPWGLIFDDEEFLKKG